MDLELTELKKIGADVSSYAGKKVTVGGWVRSIRDSKTFGFMVVHDGTYFNTLQVVFHATVKLCLFMVAGSFIVNAGKHRVDELRGYGRVMPKTLWAFTFAALSLVGIPPASGFVSKWYLAAGALNSGLQVYNWLAPVILLVSALLTAGYLLPITIDGFFPGKDCPPLPPKNKEGGPLMWVPIVLLAALSILFGICSGPLVRCLRTLVQPLFG